LKTTHKAAAGGRSLTVAQVGTRLFVLKGRLVVAQHLTAEKMGRIGTVSRSEGTGKGQPWVSIWSFLRDEIDILLLSNPAMNRSAIVKHPYGVSADRGV